ncbi:MAG: tetratricopeptide repeat protein [Armatimonadota bacterium]|nr:tetratricopeptide repeat protein [Armatimonadota bacterium]
MKHLHHSIALSIMIISIMVWFAPVPLRAASEEDAEAIYVRGEEYAAIGWHSEAIAAWQTVLDDYSDQKRVCANAKLGIGRAREAMGQIEAARQQFDELTQSYPDFRRQNAEALIEIGAILEGKREFNNAITTYRSVITNYSGMGAQCARAKLHIADCLAAMGQVDQVLVELQGLLRDHAPEREQCAQALMRIGQIQSERNQSQQATAQFEKVRADYPDMELWCAEALLWLAATQARATQNDAALATYAKLLNDYPTHKPQCVKAAVGRAALYEQMSKPAEAVREYASVLKSYPSFRRQADTAKSRIDSLLSTTSLPPPELAEVQQTVAHYVEIRDSVAMGDTEQDLAEKSGVAPDYVALRSDRVTALMRKGQAFRGLQQYDSAIAEFQKILANYDDTQEWRAEARLQMGKTEWKAGTLSKALGTLATLIANEGSATSQCADATLFRGRIFEQLGENENAAGEYRNVISKYSDKKGRFSEARYRLGCLLGKMGNRSEALAEFERLYTDGTCLSSFAVQAVEASAQMLVSDRDYSAAVAAADGALTQYPSPGRTRGRLLFIKGMIQCDARRYTDAATTLREAVAQPPQDRTALHQAQMLLAQAYLERHENQAEARVLLQSMLSDEGWTREEKARISEYIGFCYRKNSPEAEESFTTTINDYAGTASAADCYFHRSLCRSARQAYIEAAADIEMIKVPYLQHYALGDYYAAQGKKAEAASEYEQVYPNLPASFRGSYFEPYAAYVRLVELYRELGDEGRASAASEKMSQILTDHVAAAP